MTGDKTADHIIINIIITTRFKPRVRFSRSARPEAANICNIFHSTYAPANGRDTDATSTWRFRCGRQKAQRTTNTISIVKFYHAHRSVRAHCTSAFSMRSSIRKTCFGMVFTKMRWPYLRGELPLVCGQF